MNEEFLQKNVLVVGGTASISEDLVSILENNNYKIDLLTYRTKFNIKNKNRNWYFLDLENINSIYNFIEFQKNKKYSLIIFVAKIEKDGENLEFDIEHLHNSFLKFHANSLYLIASLVKNLNDSGHMVYISSAAVNTNVPHSTYIAGKAMLQAFTISLSGKSKNKQSIYVISPTRILGSKSQIENASSDIVTEYATIQNIAKKIIESDENSNSCIFQIGY